MDIVGEFEIRGLNLEVLCYLARRLNCCAAIVLSSLF